MNKNVPKVSYVWYPVYNFFQKVVRDYGIRFSAYAKGLQSFRKQTTEKVGMPTKLELRS